MSVFCRQSTEAAGIGHPPPAVACPRAGGEKRAYVRATKDGWSPEELKKLGLESGAVARRRKTTNRAASDNAAGTLNEGNGQD